jgi:outer membrane protein OmpA-like peptidoglycan-associated protein
MRAAIGACAALCLLHDLPARAQDDSGPVGPAQIYAACRHPDAADPRNTRLWNLCNRIVVPPGSLAFRPAALAQMATLPLPSPKDIRELATDAETEIRTLPLLGGFLAGTPEAPEIQFDLSSARLDSVDLALIAAVAPEAIGHLERHPDARVVVRGIASPDGTSGAVNRELANQRARAVAAELVKRGVAAQRIDYRDTTFQLPKGDIVTAEERETSRGATVAVRAPAIAFSAGIPRSRAGAALRADASAPGLAADASPAAGAMQGLSLATVANAATDVLVERASEQMQVYVIRQLSARLCVPAGQAAPAADPHYVAYVAKHMRATCSLLTQHSAAVGTTALGELRLALRRDLREMPQGLGFAALNDRRRHASGSPRYQDAVNVVLALLTFVDQVEDGAAPLRVIAGFAQTDLMGPGGVRWSLPATPAGQLPYTDGLRRFSHYAARLESAHAELAPYAGESWAIADTAFAYTLRALAVAHRASSGDERAHLSWLLDQGYAGADTVLGAYRDVNAGMERIRAITARVDTLMSGGDATQATRQALYGEAVGVLSSMAPALFLASEAKATELRTLVEPARQIVVSARTGRYGEAALGVLDLVRAPGLVAEVPLQQQADQLGTMLAQAADSLRKLDEAMKAAQQQARTLRGEAAEQARAHLDLLLAARQSPALDTAALRRTARVAGSRLASATGFPFYGHEQATMRVLSLTAGIVEARSEDQVAHALRTFVGQGRDFVSKREIGTSWRVALNAYVGLGGGGEWLEREPGIRSRPVAYGSFFVPVGVEISRPCWTRVSCGFYLPLVDLGAIAATRFGGGDVESAPEVELERIITPGAYFVLGLRGMPISLGLGGVYAPESREVEAGEEAAGRELNAFRFGGVVGFAIRIGP